MAVNRNLVKNDQCLRLFTSLRQPPLLVMMMKLKNGKKTRKKRKSNHGREFVWIEVGGGKELTEAHERGYGTQLMQTRKM